ncbi:MAG: fluoride efflux transporter CrcB [Bacteroidota bacterium]|nr:fluoride efflux transporter CrcB [Bacteroidota bacterium]
MKQLILVFLGGGIGTVLRFIISKLIPHNDSGFPWSTFSANLIGCFIIGLISGYFFKTSSTNQSDILLFATVGICGGFTTFSTFAYENINFLKSGDFIFFITYTLGSFILGILMVYFGLTLHKYFH